MSFDTAVDRVLKEEGGYSNDSNDTGGETFRGVSRNNFPKWEGWAILDIYKKQSDFPQNALKDEALTKMAKRWYKQNFWDIFGLDAVNPEQVAYEVFEQSVNMGAGRGAEHIQKVCNALNYKNRFGEDVIIDGKNGPATRGRLGLVANSDAQTALALAIGLNCLQGAFYIQLGLSTNSKSDYRKYTKGWLSNRAKDGV